MVTTPKKSTKKAAAPAKKAAPAKTKTKIFTPGPRPANVDAEDWNSPNWHARMK